MKLEEFSVANVPVITHIKVSADNKSVLLLVSQSLILLFLGFDERVLLNDYNGWLDKRQPNIIHSVILEHFTL